MQPVTAQAHPNIAFIKYWGNRDHVMRLPSNGSISMNLDGLFTRTTIHFSPHRQADSLLLNDEAVSGPALQRISSFLDLVREKAGIQDRAEVISVNNFPLGAGIASSASGFAALALAATSAAGLDLPESELSALARRGSGSAARSVPAGFVEWLPGTGDLDSFAVSIAPPAHWDLTDCIAVVSAGQKKTGSSEGHVLASTSPLQAARLSDTPRRLELCRQAIRLRDFEALAGVMELDSDMMHAVMMTSTPGLYYWLPSSLEVMGAVRSWRQEGLPVAYTVDAGPNIHVLCPGSEGEQVSARLGEIPGVSKVLIAHAGGPARLLPN